jgi:hypothetical protein
MAKNHGAKQQKKLAKQKAKRLEKRAILARRTSNDPTIRLQRAEKWPVVQALAGAKIWQDGIGYLAIVRQESEGSLIYAVYLVDVFCLGVKNAFWDAGSPGDFKELVRKLEQTQSMRPIAPECLVKIVRGAVEYAQSFGFRPHPDYRHAAMLLGGIDPTACPQEFTFGRDGKPFYIRGPHESLEQARAIVERIQDAGGEFIVQVAGPGSGDFAGIEGGFEEFDSLEEDDSPGE